MNVGSRPRESMVMYCRYLSLFIVDIARVLFLLIHVCSTTGNVFFIWVHVCPVAVKSVFRPDIV